MSSGEDDHLFGGTGDDVLLMKGSNAIAEGGEGIDQFHFEGRDIGRVTLTDFQAGSEKILLDDEFFHRNQLNVSQDGEDLLVEHTRLNWGSGRIEELRLKSVSLEDIDPDALFYFF